MADGSHDVDKDIETLNAVGNNASIGLWSNSTTLWVSDIVDDKLYAYTLANGARNAAKDINDNLLGMGATPRGIWSNSTILWINNSSRGILAYQLE